MVHEPASDLPALGGRAGGFHLQDSDIKGILKTCPV